MRRSLAPVVLVAAIAAASCTKSPTRVHIDDRATHWQTHGFVELVPTIRPPTTPDRRDEVHVWLDVPAGARINVVGDSLRVPPGTVADRVETRGAGNVDVRGTRFADGGVEWFHVYHDPAEKPGAPVDGWEWRRDDVKQGQAATEALIASLSTQPVEQQRKLRFFNDCASCHTHDRPALTRADQNGPRRRTDGSGLYELYATLEDTAPLEVNRPFDVNADDRFVLEKCGDRPAQLQAGPQGRRWACRDGTIPVATYQLADALTAGEERAHRVCASRRYLYEHMDEPARAKWSASFAECSIP